MLYIVILNRFCRLRKIGNDSVCAKFIPKLLTTEQKNFRFEIIQDNLKIVNNDENILKKIITGDESWVYGKSTLNGDYFEGCHSPDDEE